MLALFVWLKMDFKTGASTSGVPEGASTSGVPEGACTSGVPEGGGNPEAALPTGGGGSSNWSNKRLKIFQALDFVVATATAQVFWEQATN